MNQRGSTSPMMYQGDTPVTEIILHCSATQPGWMAGKHISDKYAEIDRWHRERGFRTIGYHWIIDRDGQTVAGRAETVQGAHVKGRNRGTIGVCLLGGHGGSATDSFADHFTAKQRTAVWKLVRQIDAKTDLRRITGHNQFSAKACPCFQVGEEFPWPPATQSKWAALIAAILRFLQSIFKRRTT